MRKTRSVSKILLIVGLISLLSSCSSTVVNKPAPKPTAAPGVVSHLKAAQVGNRVVVSFSDVSIFRSINSYVVTWKGSSVGTYAGKGTESGTYKVKTPAMSLGSVKLTVHLLNSIGEGPESSKTLQITGPKPINGLSVEQSSGTTIDISWDAASSGPVPSYYLVQWSGSGSGSKKVQDTSFSFDGTAGKTVHVSVTAVVTGIRNSSPVAKSLQIQAPWNSSPDGDPLQWRSIGGSCQGYSSYGCVRVQVSASSDCLNGVYIEANNMDSNSNVTGFGNDSLGALRSGQSAIMEMDFTESGGYFQVVHLTCHNF